MNAPSFIFAILPVILMICIITSLFWVVIYARGKWTFSSGITVFRYLQQYRWFHFGNISLLSLSVILTTGYTILSTLCRFISAYIYHLL